MSKIEDLDVGSLDGSEKLEPAGHVAFAVSVESADAEKGLAPSRALDPQQRVLRWQNTVASVCMFGMVSGIFGASPLVDLMNKGAPPGLEWLAPGVTVFAVTHCVAQTLILPVTGGMVKKATPLQIWFLVAVGILNPLSIGLSAHYGCFWLQYVGAIIGSISLATALEYTQVIVLQWWAIDGKQHIGLSLQGAMMASTMVMFSLMLGWTGNAWGLAAAAFSEVCLLAVMCVFPLVLAMRGVLGPPPAQLLAPRSLTAKPVQTTAGSLIRSAEFWHVALHQFVVPFTGFGMKLLLTSVFAAAYGTSFLKSAYLASVSMVLFVVARGTFPLISRKVPLLSVLTVLLLLNAVLYASYPTIIAHLSVWWLLAAKAIAGATFAGMLCLNPLLLLHVCSPQDLPVVFAMTGPARGLGFALGPISGYYIFLTCQHNGLETYQSYNPFFYACAGMSLAAAINVALLRRTSAKKSPGVLNA